MNGTFRVLNDSVIKPKRHGYCFSLQILWQVLLECRCNGLIEIRFVASTIWDYSARFLKCQRQRPTSLLKVKQQ